MYRALRVSGGPGIGIEGFGVYGGYRMCGNGLTCVLTSFDRVSVTADNRTIVQQTGVVGCRLMPLIHIWYCSRCRPVDADRASTLGRATGVGRPEPTNLRALEP